MRDDFVAHLQNISGKVSVDDLHNDKSERQKDYFSQVNATINTILSKLHSLDREVSGLYKGLSQKLWCRNDMALCKQLILSLWTCKQIVRQTMTPEIVGTLHNFTRSLVELVQTTEPYERIMSKFARTTEALEKRLQKVVTDVGERLNAIVSKWSLLLDTIKVSAATSEVTRFAEVVTKTLPFQVDIWMRDVLVVVGAHVVLRIRINVLDLRNEARFL
ncbi:unnamed protein product [Soboliphyme baturini]|uniref:DHC_N1 domain-containing protein n=1 Tax=Soboliphyme baturini TaxID=241478 RepID=A0A183J331_9BILA|nr:unnamed protein product [Soboliphyme baturini]